MVARCKICKVIKDFNEDSLDQSLKCNQINCNGICEWEKK